MMNEEENATYDKLPDSVPVCRGFDVAEKRGLSWSLDEEIANAFPFQTCFKANDPIVIRAQTRPHCGPRIEQQNYGSSLQVNGDYEVLTCSIISSRDIPVLRHLAIA